METFGPPLIFVTPNVADTQHPLLLIVQGEQIDLGAVSADMASTLPKYRDMLRRVAQDPVGQVVQFEMLMRLFLQHVLNVRPETLDCRRNSVRAACREWCSDGVAAAWHGWAGSCISWRNRSSGSWVFTSPHLGVVGLWSPGGLESTDGNLAHQAARTATTLERIHAIGGGKF